MRTAVPAPINRTEPQVIPLEEPDFHHVMSQTPGVALVYFTHSACSSCRVLARSLTEMLAAGDDLQVFAVDAAHNMGLVREMEVFHLPAMFLFRDGHFHRPLDSEPTPARLREVIASTLALPPVEAP